MDTFQRLLNHEIGLQKAIYSYQYLRNHGKMGYRTEIRDGALCHCLNQDMMITVLHYKRENNVKISMYMGEVSFHHEITDEEMPRHVNDFIELTYVIQGNIHVIVDQDLMTFSENELYLINPNVPYQEQKKVSDAIVLNISLRSSFFNELVLSNIPEDSLQGFLRKCLMKEKNSTKVLHFMPSVDTEQKKISEIYSQILFEYKNRETGYLSIIQGYFSRLMDHLVSGYQFSFTEDIKSKYKEYMFQEVKKYLYNNYRSVRLQDLEDTFHYSGNYFNRLIQDFTGKNYSSYLIHIRVKVARDMLEYTNENIDTIMEQVGYHNKGFFYKAFTEEYGKTPAAYRRALKAK